MATAFTEEAMRAVALKWTYQDLLTLWQEIQAGQPIPGWSPGKAFEYLVIAAFHLEQAEVRWPYAVTFPQKWGMMEQLDGMVYLRDRPFIIESKDLSESLAIEAVAKLRFRLERRPMATMAVLFSTSGFSLPTEIFTQFASPMNVLLWDGRDLDVALRSRSMLRSLQLKFQFASEHGLPHLTLEGR